MIGVGLALALLACLGSFVDSSVKTMTGRTVSGLPIDWQILLNARTDEKVVQAAVHETDPEARMETIEYADVPGLVAKTGETVQTTGQAAVLGIDAPMVFVKYRKAALGVFHFCRATKLPFYWV